MKKLFNFLLSTLIVASLLSCKSEPGVKLDYYKYTLENGLTVVLHQDHSDPIVALAIQYHVGSGREKPGKTGFAHFFEHMLFQRSENLPRNAFFQNIAKMGGTFNGSTNADGTNYYESVPRDALEKILWMESDRMGFFINTVTQSGLEREIDIVSNEKRQNYDSQPYGQSSIIIAKELYPPGHPYSWTTIGEIADLRSATLDDVKEFYHTFYLPNNATLVLTGDFEKETAKALIEKYFAEIPAGPKVEKPQPQPAVLEENKLVMWEDAYARLPQISVTFPTVEQYHPHSYALNLFASLFAGSKVSPLHKIVVEEKRLAPSVNAFNMTREIAGQMQITVRAFNGTDLNRVYHAIQEAFDRFVEEGVDEQELQKLKIMQEVNLYNRMSSVLGKAVTIARDDVFGGYPDMSFRELESIRRVTAKDIIEVYEKYFKNSNHLVLSVVPAGMTNLAVNGSTMGEVTIERVEDQELKSQGGAIVDDPYQRTPSSFDRSVEPDYMDNSPSITIPQVWTTKLTNGMEIYGITHNELPVINATITIRGGMLLDAADKGGLSYLTARLMNEGTSVRSAGEMESALGLLGARISVSSDIENTYVNISALSRNFAEVVVLLEEFMLMPAFDESAFTRIKEEAKSQIRQSFADPRNIARQTRDLLLYGSQGTFSKSHLGTMESIDNITLDDIKEFYASNFSPSVAKFNIAGDIDLKRIEKMLVSLVKNWEASDVTIPEPVQGIPAKTGQIYFVDNPGSPQSMIFVSKPGLEFSHPQYYPWVITNYRLGSGSQGMLFDVLRLQKGFTYGASSSLEAGRNYNNFTAASSVQASTTAEAVSIFHQLIDNYKSTFNQEMLDDTKNSMSRAMASSFETLGSLLRVLGNISGYGMPFDYVKGHERVLNEMTLEEALDVIRSQFDASEMVFIVVGDAKTQLKPLESVGLGKPILVKL